MERPRPSKKAKVETKEGKIKAVRRIEPPEHICTMLRHKEKQKLQRVSNELDKYPSDSIEDWKARRKILKDAIKKKRMHPDCPYLHTMGLSPLYQAIQHHDERFVAFLLKHHANLITNNIWLGRSVLTLVCKTTIAVQLLKNGLKNKYPLLAGTCFKK